MSLKTDSTREIKINGKTWYLNSTLGDLRDQIVLNAEPVPEDFYISATSLDYKFHIIAPTASGNDEYVAASKLCGSWITVRCDPVHRPYEDEFGNDEVDMNDLRWHEFSDFRRHSNLAECLSFLRAMS